MVVVILGFAFSRFLDGVASGHGDITRANNRIEDGFDALLVSVNVLGEELAVHLYGYGTVALFERDGTGFRLGRKDEGACNGEK